MLRRKSKSSTAEPQSPSPSSRRSSDPSDDGSGVAVGPVPRRLSQLGAQSSDWERRSDIDNIFVTGGAPPVITRHSSARRMSDGTFDIDESVPQNVRQALQEMEQGTRSGPTSKAAKFLGLNTGGQRL